MRKGRREVLLVLVVFLAGTMVRAARYEKGKPAGSEDLVGITVELSWTTPGAEVRAAPGAKPVPAPELTLGMTEGVVTEVVSWPPESSRLRMRADQARVPTATGISEPTARGACVPGSR